jgi:NAD(P)-dependent dehydrogenase (short-subunit alcohol dehydrogenase family)
MYIISGASRGIGKFLLEKYITEGKDVIGLYNSTLPEKFKDNYYQIDVTDEHQIDVFINTFMNQFKDIILINAAGISYNAFGHKANIDLWKKVIDTNLIGLFNLTSKLLPIMRNDNFGRVINFSSVVAQKGIPGTSAYAASKSALWGMAKALAVENGNKNITINNINLGYFNVGMIEQVPENILQDIIKSIPAQRLGNPEEILSLVNLIINNGYLNGASIDLNGGML